MTQVIEFLLGCSMADITPMFIASQIFGFLVLVFAIVMVHFKKIGQILFFEFLVNVLTALSYILVGGISGGWICFTATFQTAVSWLYERMGKKLPVWITAGFIIIYIAISASSYSDYNDILSALCAVIFALTIVQEKPSKYRIMKALNMGLWIVYDYNTMAFSLIITHGIIMTSTIIAIVKEDVKKRYNQVD